jgi:hypothetical protein
VLWAGFVFFFCFSHLKKNVSSLQNHIRITTGIEGKIPPLSLTSQMNAAFVL